MNKKMLLIIIAVALFIIIIAGVVFFMLSINSSKPKEEVLKLDKNIIMYSFEDSFVTNIKDSKKILKTVIDVEIADKKIEELITAREPEIRNEINLILRSKTEKDLEGSEGQESLQNELLASLRKIIKTEKIINIYFKEFIIQ